jgi:hypothetical protein
MNTETETIKQQIQRHMVNPIHLLRTDLIVVAETCTSISFNTLTKKLDIMNAMVNKEYFGKKFKVMPQENRIVMNYNNQYSPKQHTHSHLLVKIPKHLKWQDVLDTMDKCWKHLDDRKKNKKFKIYVRETSGKVDNVIYATRQLKDNYKDNEFGWL